MSNTLETIDDLTFETEVLNSKLPYLLGFSASWCGPCRALHPIIESLAQQYRGALRVGLIDLDASPAVGARFNVRGVPTVLVFRDGQEYARRIGLCNRAALLKLTGLQADMPSSATAR